jgi:ABC-2 type transport system ATP-binding protein
VGLVGRAARDAIDRVVAACELGAVTGRLAGTLSKGFRQRIGLAAAMLGEPRLLILDEPSVGLDPHQLQGFRRLLRELGRERTVLLSSHLLGEIEAVCDRAVLLSEGRLVAEGSIAELVGGAAGDTSALVAEVRGSGAEAVLAEVLGPAALAATWSDFADGWRRVRVAMTTARAGDAAAELAAAWTRRGIAVRELRRERGSLEDAFVRATAREVAR